MMETNVETEISRKRMVIHSVITEKYDGNGLICTVHSEKENKKFKTIIRFKNNLNEEILKEDVIEDNTFEDVLLTHLKYVELLAV